MRKKSVLRTFATTLVIGAAAFLYGTAPSWAQSLTKLKVSIIPIVDIAPFEAARTMGYFKEEGIEVDSTPTVGGADGIPGAIAGAYDIVYTNIVSALIAKQQGFDIRVIASGSRAGVTPPDTAGLLKRKGEPMMTGKDLEGKSVAVNARNNINWLITAAWIKNTGGDPSKVNYREVPFPQMIDALKTKQVDVAHAVEPFLANGLRDPSLELMAWPWSSALPGTRAAQWIITDETAQKRPEAVQKFVRALRKGAAWLNANNGNEEFFKLIAGYTKLDPARLQSMNIREIQTDIDLDQMRKLTALSREHGLINREIDVAAMVFDTP